MAKSIRASVSKRNRANLRKKVFGPVVDARTERLAAKLQELASQPRPKAPENSNMESNSDDSAGQGSDAKAAPADEAMDIDVKSSKRHQKGRVQKSKKPRNNIVFKAHPSKAKKGPKRK
ncbi:uncharacterized protein N7484_001706 [Penicillium longicatenatum]|uniref:uncharacterized protein n=1 Tax=Penicillium longicatenatum TaxID=1561947 RepID=UPI00254838B7|nr:uncharacterized protein N7484_001706 [Penicillium longicatenatum]KAJ5658057.1 hypothetical protein N7484_001706 [Penicillium longicatenatum]KAJ5663739.1 hypothetical protein N7507_004470 [Penicillium longicatenatum]